jgi:hypothetical protein
LFGNIFQKGIERCPEKLSENYKKDTSLMAPVCRNIIIILGRCS